jgi:hypothetical protein
VSCHGPNGDVGDGTVALELGIGVELAVLGFQLCLGAPVQPAESAK